MPRFSTICIWWICASLSALLPSCGSTVEYDRGPEGMRWKLLAYRDRGGGLDSAEIIYMDAVVLSTRGDTLAQYFDTGFTASADSLWWWLKTKKLGDSLEIVRTTPDFLYPHTAPGDTVIYRLAIDRMRSARELADAKTAEWLYLDSLIRTDSVRLHYREFNEVYLRVLAPGDTSRPVTKGKGVVISYLGALPDGTVFDDSRQAAGPLEFVYGNEGQVIRGLEVALAALHRGSRARVIIPSRLAFGDGSKIGRILPPYSTVVYYVSVEEVAR